MRINEFQSQIERIYLQRDRARGAAGTFAWLVEEIGELSRALRRGDGQNLEDEFADVLAWTVSLASILGIEVESVIVRRYGEGCPKCGATPCGCPA